MTSLSDLVEVVIGVDTHVDTHTAAIIDAGTGGVLGQVQVAATPAGYAELVEFVDTHLRGEDEADIETDPCAATGGRAWAIEGTRSHGAGLTRHLQARGELVIEIDRPQRAKRRRGAKSDPIDAVRAAREALTREHLATPRSGGNRHALAILLSTRDSLVTEAGRAARQVFHLIITAPEPLRAKFAGKKLPAMITTAARLRTRPGQDIETTTTITILRDLARRAQDLTTQAAQYKKQIHHIVTSMRADLLDQPGIGPIVAARILCAWSHPGRIHSEAAFAMLAGVAPIPATSGRTTNRHRLNRHGDRQLNRALHVIVLTRLRHDPHTRAYAQRRTTQGRTHREITRCLKRYIARDIYRQLEHHNPTNTP
ncbi:IS110 family transposase [Ruania alkalisoli]|uniref:IS110 family transposase n=1 Tax=Ruania alkalisoli TaxID=2779775 RepID=A0A7M1SSS2_9MICO|nr:IS110 family transposase [Ruania alkalisoli]QOR70138.1 IS110 family transposase [Ruania alkalisoli]QOR70501.1 IS110 family transposase [Ruania alkalisoli]QOR71137.1 IS110 family transposase [Ruania alkalisoli]QOR71150.1 IS110 family transposase [Ruania alkalisoli]QOR71155.1 IS110 family transposase [Ruania alkalisoli]